MDAAERLNTKRQELADLQAEIDELQTWIKVATCNESILPAHKTGRGSKGPATGSNQNNLPISRSQFFGNCERRSAKLVVLGCVTEEIDSAPDETLEGQYTVASRVSGASATPESSSTALIQPPTPAGPPSRRPKQKSAVSELCRWYYRCFRKGAEPTQAQLDCGWPLLLAAIEQKKIYSYDHAFYTRVWERVARLKAETEKESATAQP
jgi:hypothetical protein